MRENIDVNQFRADGSKPLPVDTPVSHDSYNSRGELIGNDDDKCVAKSVDGRSYYLRVATEGMRMGKLFDPAQDSVAELVANSRITGFPLYRYKKVNQQAFNLYITYLKEGGVSMLYNAERSIDNGF